MRTSRIPAACAALLFTLLVGQISDRTTGQPLAGVHVVLHSGRSTRRVLSDVHGRFRLVDVRSGRYRLRYWSNDVPPQSLLLRVRGARQRVRIAACSTTLDYRCGNAGGGG